MFNRFTEKSRKVIVFSKEAANRLNSDCIYTEHLLLGLIKVDDQALVVLKKLGVSPESIQLEMDKLVKQETQPQKSFDIPFSRDAKKALELTAASARELGHSYLGTEHLLLGLIKEETGKAHQVLIGLGLNTEAVSKVILELSGSDSEKKPCIELPKNLIKPAPDFITSAILFKETITQSVKSVAGKYIQHSTGRGRYGHVVIDVEPIDYSKGIIFINRVRDAIPERFIASIEEGINIGVSKGILAQYPVTGILVTLVDGSYHEIDSDGAFFQLGAKFTLQEALRKGQSILLEPIMHYQITITDEYFGTITGELSRRRAQIISAKKEGSINFVECLVPLMEMLDYSLVLHVQSKGTACFSMKPDRDAPLPLDIAQKIIEIRQKENDSR